jgi:uncharacterized membrane protein
MTTFQLYLRLGLEHIADFNGYDHILFIVILCAVYKPGEWKRVLILVTAFTLGHSLTLALATLNWIQFSRDWIEFLIPVTIFITAWFNIAMYSERKNKILHSAKYMGALFFGLIHGMGFSSYLRSLLGAEEKLLAPLFSFNLGIEIGQILIVVVIMLLGYLFSHIRSGRRIDWNLVVSGAGMGISLVLIIERFPL